MSTESCLRSARRQRATNERPRRIADRQWVDDVQEFELIIFSCTMAGLTGGASISMLMPWHREKAMKMMQRMIVGTKP
jgi:hypothetical protein